jgi:acyl-CoA hydrolase
MTLPAESSLQLVLLMTSDMANASGVIHGGRLLSLLDNTAYACATRYSRCNVVTASVEDVAFKAPLEVGDIATISAAIQTTGRSSMEVSIRVDAEHIRTGKRRLTHTGRFRMVALDQEGRPASIAPLPPAPVVEVGS